MPSGPDDSAAEPAKDPETAFPPVVPESLVPQPANISPAEAAHPSSASEVSSEPGPVSAETPPVAPPALTAEQRFNERRAQVEREFQEVKRVGLFYGAQLVPLLALAGWVFHGSSVNELNAECWGAGFLYAVIAGFAWAWRSDLRGLFKWPQQTSARIWAAVIITPILSIGSASLFVSLMEAWGLPNQRLLTPMLEADWPTLFIYVWIALLPAVFEEIAFRGLILTKLQRVMTPLQALWVSSILFGILHFTILGLAVFLVPLAWVAGRLRQKTGALWPAFIIHCLHNAGIITLELLF